MSRHVLYLLLGSNIQRPLKQLAIARDLLQKHLGKIIKVSSIFKTAAWGAHDQPNFFNQVIKLQSTRKAITILRIVKNIEVLMGRASGPQWGPRIIDIDLLFYGQTKIKSKELILPHPLLESRRFALVPLVEIAPNFRHPITQKSMLYLLNVCPDSLPVKRVKHA